MQSAVESVLTAVSAASSSSSSSARPPPPPLPGPLPPPAPKKKKAVPTRARGSVLYAGESGAVPQHIFALEQKLDQLLNAVAMLQNNIDHLRKELKEGNGKVVETTKALLVGPSVNRDTAVSQPSNNAVRCRPSTHMSNSSVSFHLQSDISAAMHRLFHVNHSAKLTEIQTELVTFKPDTIEQNTWLAQTTEMVACGRFIC